MNSNINTIKFYWQQIRKYKVSFFVAAICTPLAALTVDVMLPYFLSQTIGGLAPLNQVAIQHNITLAIITASIGGALNLIGFQTLSHHEAHIRYELGKETFQRLIGKDISFFANEKIGALTSRYIDFLRSHVSLQDLLIIRTMSFVISVGTGLVIVGLQSPLLAVVLAVLLLLIILQVKFSIKFRKPYRHARKQLIAESNGAVADALTNSVIVKTFAGEKTELSHLNTINANYLKAFMKDFRLMSFEGTARVSIMMAIQIIAISLCVSLVSHGSMSVPVAVFMLVYLQRIASQLFTLGDMLNGYDQALLEAAPMSDILMINNEVVDVKDAAALHDITPVINFKQTSYHYKDSSANVIDSLNLSIAAGEKIGLVGTSGAGKTTLTHLLLRFADVTDGSISIDSHDIRDITQESLRQHIAYVPQEPMLFHRSLRDNIAYGKQGATDEEIRRAAMQANAIDFIQKLPQQFDTLVGERGVKLSGGQRQRIAIARALLKDAPILVLDEATSALDSESEKLIQDALTKLMKGRTSIVIAHRLSTIAKLDRIVVLDNGAIAEQGTHNELLRQKGIYAKLWSHQSGGFIEE